MTTQVKCPTCDKTCAFDSSNAYRPFCSERCQLIDLGKWASEEYKLPVNTHPSAEEEEEEEFETNYTE